MGNVNELDKCKWCGTVLPPVFSNLYYSSEFCVNECHQPDWINNSTGLCPVKKGEEVEVLLATGKNPREPFITNMPEKLNWAVVMRYRTVCVPDNLVEKAGGILTATDVSTRLSPKGDVVNNPKHYTAHPSGIECIQVTEHMNFCLGNAIKYIWRADEKGNSIEDLKKAAWYIAREITRRGGDK